MPGAFVTIEGPEGAGKTSHAERLRDRAVGAGIDVVLTREPGGTPLGERIREVLLDPGARHDPRTDALLFNAARAQLLKDVIEPALARRALVICARFADSTVAYQGHGAGLPADDLRTIERFATGGRRPDLTLLLDLPIEDGLSRKHDEQTRFETRFDLDFHRRVRAGFLAMAAAEPDRFRVIDATRPADAVFADVVGAVAGLPGLGGLGGTEGAPGRTEPLPAAERIHR